MCVARRYLCNLRHAKAKSANGSDGRKGRGRGKKRTEEVEEEDDGGDFDEFHADDDEDDGSGEHGVRKKKKTSSGSERKRVPVTQVSRAATPQTSYLTTGEQLYVRAAC